MRRFSSGIARGVAAAPVPETRNLPKLHEAAAGCKACDLWKTGTQTVFGEGSKSAAIVFVGEQPGDKEDLAGKPFVGPAGRVFDERLAAAGIDRRTCLRHERGQALQVGGARKAADPPEAERGRARRVQALAGRRARGRPAECPRPHGRDRGAGASRPPVQGDERPRPAASSPTLRRASSQPCTRPRSCASARMRSETRPWPTSSRT